MKPFQFRLKNYLKIKEHEERTAWSDVISQQAVVDGLQVKIDRILTQVHQARQSVSDVGNEKLVTIASAQMNNDMISSLNKKKLFIESSLVRENQLLDNLQIVHKQLKTEKRVIEVYRDKKYKNYKKDKNKKEAKRLDEVAGQIYARRRDNESL